MQPKQRFRALVTGGSRGIGRAIVQAIALHCDHITAVSRNPDAAGAANALPGSVTYVSRAGDVTDADFVKRLVAEIETGGGINLLINNAGVSEFASFESQPLQSMRQMCDINLLAPMLMSQSFLPLLLKEPESHIINIGSALGYLGYPGYAAYCATKFGLRGFTEALFRELDGTSVRVRLFSPRATQTDINSEAVRSMNRDLGVQADSPEEVARQFVDFLLGPKSEHRIGFPESLFTRINQIAPGLVGSSLRKQLPRIRAAMKDKTS